MRNLCGAAALALGAVLAGMTAGGVSAQTAAPVQAYGALPAVEMVEISPGGQRLALVTVAGEDRVLVVIDPKQGQVLGRIEVGLAKVRDLRWVGDGDLLITTSTAQALLDVTGPTRELFLGQAYNVDRRRLTTVPNNTPGTSPTLGGWPLVSRTPQGAAAFVRLYSFQNRDMDLYRIDLATGRGRSVVDLPSNIDDVVLDPDGAPLARAAYRDQTGEWGLETWDGRAFRPIWGTTRLLDPPALLGLGRDGRSVMVSAERDGDDGRRLYEVTIDGEWKASPFDRAPTGLVHHPVSRVLIGAYWEQPEGRRYRFLDDAASQAWTRVESAFPNRRPELQGWSDDLNQVVVFVSGDGDAGSYHLIDLAGRSTSAIGQTYPAIGADQVGVTRPIDYTATDGLKVEGYLTLPPGQDDARGLPLIVLAHGGPASADRMEFDWWSQALASRGYAVLRANFRGSTGRGEAFREAGYGEWGRKMQTDLSDGVKWLSDQGVVDPARVCIVGASYGGYAAMAGVTVEQDVYRCAVAVAGVSDLRRMVAVEARDSRRNSQVVRYWNRFMGGDGPGDRSLDARSPARLTERLTAPVLLIHGKDDTVVPIEQSRMFRDAARRAGKPVEFLELPGEDHWMSRAETRQRMLAETVRFLEAHNPVD